LGWYFKGLAQVASPFVFNDGKFGARPIRCFPEYCPITARQKGVTFYLQRFDFIGSPQQTQFTWQTF
jgi:hypothetical protein